MIPREILKKIRQIEIRTNRLVSETLAGQYHSVFKGQGMNFEEVREYQPGDEVRTDRKSTRLNSSHSQISYAVFCLKKKTNRNCGSVGGQNRLWPQLRLQT